MSCQQVFYTFIVLLAAQLPFFFLIFYFCHVRIVPNDISQSELGEARMAAAA